MSWRQRLVSESGYPKDILKFKHDSWMKEYSETSLTRIKKNTYDLGIPYT